MLKKYKADFHIHTCLSPCAELDMTPRRIIGRAMERSLDIIAITDHNAAENVFAANRIESSVTIIPGMEITTSEEAHVIALMPDIDSLMELRSIVKESMPAIITEKLAFEQVIVNENDEVEGFIKELLINATSLEAERVVKIIHQYGGIAIAAHVDRDVYSILTQLGFIPDDMDFDALEISFRTSHDEAETILQPYRRYPWIKSSDAHHLVDIGRCYTEFLIKEPTFEEIMLALQGKEGREVIWHG
ncbi:MAG: PHP domain-containing protein [Nitrospirae bacterium]|nr:PHP domain-containing protein [Nitrospirota bacterium]